jgi:hypothetical protein
MTAVRLSFRGSGGDARSVKFTPRSTIRVPVLGHFWIVLSGLVRAVGIEPTRAKAQRIFIPATAFAATQFGRLWSGLSLHRASANRRVGAARLVSTPSAVLSRCGLARDRHLTGFPEFEQFCIAGFPASTQFGLSPLRLPIPPRPRCQGGYRLSLECRQGRRRVGGTGRPVSVSFSGA